MNRPITYPLTVAGSAVALAAAYPLLLRRRCLRWGATPQEAARSLPGDDLLRQPELVSTRAITIDAPPDAIWPWLVQMGSGRGGAYTYDWIENLLGLNMHSADEILPEFQDLKAGDVLPVGANGPAMMVAILEPEQVLCLQADNVDWVWTFALYPAGDGTTRLISRNLIATPGASPPRRVMNLLVVEPGSLLMERRMLLGIKSRAERTARLAGHSPRATATVR
jgi:hypothetical protein